MNEGREDFGQKDTNSVRTGTSTKNIHVENAAVQREITIITELHIKSSHCLITNSF